MTAAASFCYFCYSNGSREYVPAVAMRAGDGLCAEHLRLLGGDPDVNEATPDEQALSVNVPAAGPAPAREISGQAEECGDDAPAPRRARASRYGTVSAQDCREVEEDEVPSRMPRCRMPPRGRLGLLWDKLVTLRERTPARWMCIENASMRENYATRKVLVDRARRAGMVCEVRRAESVQDTRLWCRLSAAETDATAVGE